MKTTKYTIALTAEFEVVKVHNSFAIIMSGTGRGYVIDAKSEDDAVLKFSNTLKDLLLSSGNFEPKIVKNEPMSGKDALKMYSNVKTWRENFGRMPVQKELPSNISEHQVKEIYGVIDAFIKKNDRYPSPEEVDGLLLWERSEAKAAMEKEGGKQ